ncbi:MAG: hypothetical protein ACI9WC_001847 [Arenicella sp.]
MPSKELSKITYANYAEAKTYIILAQGMPKDWL